MRASTILSLLPLASAVLAAPGQAVYARAPEEIAGYDSEPTTTSTYVVYVTITQTEDGPLSTAYITPSPKPQQFHGNESIDDEEEETEDEVEEEYLSSYPSGTGTWTTVIGGANNTGISGAPLPSQTESEGGAARIVASLGCMAAVGLAGVMAMW